MNGKNLISTHSNVGASEHIRFLGAASAKHAAHAHDVEPRTKSVLDEVKTYPNAAATAAAMARFKVVMLASSLTYDAAKISADIVGGGDRSGSSLCHPKDHAADKSFGGGGAMIYGESASEEKAESIEAYYSVLTTDKESIVPVYDAHREVVVSCGVGGGRAAGGAGGGGTAGSLRPAASNPQDIVDSAAKTLSTDKGTTSPVVASERLYNFQLKVISEAYNAEIGSDDESILVSVAGDTHLTGDGAAGADCH